MLFKNFKTYSPLTVEIAPHVQLNLIVAQNILAYLMSNDSYRG